MRCAATAIAVRHSTPKYTKAALSAAAKAFAADPNKGGFWLPPAGIGGLGAIEIKTAWRDFGNDAGACPSDIMYCETDSLGVRWGLVGMLLVQKTQQHGEMIWTIFEHVANVPDCSAGNVSAPIAREPSSPVGGGTINVNKKLGGGIAARTGWSYFNFDSYRTQGGDGSTCSFPDGLFNASGSTCGTPSANPLCNTDPRLAGNQFRQVNICRTDPVPASSGSCLAPDNTSPARSAQNVACLNQSVLASFPPTLAAKWKYYRMIGTTWGYDGASNFGTAGTGCFSITGPAGTDSFTCPNPARRLRETAGIDRRGNPFLASTVTETWLQKGMCLPSDTVTWKMLTRSQDCFSCHVPQTASWGEADLSHLFIRVTQSGSSRMVPSH